MDKVRYARHIALAEIGLAGQENLAAARMLVIGLGGLGCPAAQYLASSGVGALVVNDFDKVDRSNLARQILFTDADIEALKVEAAARALRLLNPEIAVETLHQRLDDDALTAAVQGVDIVLDCTDNFSTRLAINRACVTSGTPLVTGAALRMEGQLAVFSNDGSGSCYRCLYSEADELLGDCAGNGVLAPVPGVIGSLMAVEAIKLAALGNTAMASKLSLWDAVSGSWQTIALAKDPDCPVCGGR